jgi:hypothetical protein
MKKTVTLSVPQLVASVVVMVALVGFVASQVGYKAGVKSQQNKLLSQANEFDRQLSDSRLASSHMQSDYDTACYNYQTLYAAYDQLYKKAGVGTGLPFVSLPDGAKGNETSCYR